MSRRRLWARAVLVLAPGLISLPLLICWCRPPETVSLAALSEAQPGLDLSSRRLLLAPGLPFGSDLGFASQAAHNFVQSVREGVVYPRWVDSCNRGFGAPTFFFYPPLPYYLVTAASTLAPDVVGAMRLVLIFAAFAAAFSFFVAARDVVSRPVAAVGAAVYVLAPFHVLDLYDRFAFASYLAFAWFPLLFLHARRLVRRADRRAWLGLAVCYAGLIVTHLVSGFLVLFVLGPYVVAHVAWKRRWHRLAPVVGAGLVAVGCAAIYLVPLMAYRDDVHMEWVVDAPYGDWRRNFVFRDEVALGFAPAPIKPWVNLSFGAQLLLAVAATALWGRARRRAPTPGDDDPRFDAHEVPVLLALCAWTFFLQIPPSAFVWAVVPELGTVQFPWRFGAFNALPVCLLFCHALQRLAGVPVPSAGDRTRNPSGAILARAATVTVLLSVAPALLLSARLTFNRHFIFDERVARLPVYYTRVMWEYIPQTVSTWRQWDRVPVDVTPAAVDSGNPVQVLDWTTHSRKLRVDLDRPDILHLRTFDFPGWRAAIDGRAAPIVPDPSTGAITVQVPAGDHEVSFHFAGTPVRQAGGAITLLSLATMIGLRLAHRRRAQADT